MTSAASSQLETLTRINLQDLIVSIGMEKARRGRGLIERLFWLPARRFAQQMVAYDQNVARRGLHAASAETLNGYVGQVEIHGSEHLLAEGPLLVLSNHPGMTDTLVQFAGLPRPDLRIVAGVRPFLQALTHVTPYLIYVPDDPGQRMGVVRSVVAHLRQGGAVLTFPAGKIEPDPSCMPGAAASLADWSDSLAVFTRLVPETSIVVSIVSGVIWKAAVYHPLTRLRKDKESRERLGAALQVLVHTSLPFYRPVTTRVDYSAPIAPRDQPKDAQALMQLVRERALHLMQSIPQQ